MRCVLGEQASIQKDAPEPEERAAASCLLGLPPNVGAGLQREQSQPCPRRASDLSHLRQVEMLHPVDVGVRGVLGLPAA